jgi:hypothetical protein
MKEYLVCEMCRFLNEEPVPCERKKGKGRVAYRHPACEKYKEKEKRK